MLLLELIILVSTIKLTFLFLVISSVNVVIVFIFWMYILYISYVKTTRWKPPLLPHILMFGLLLASAAGKYIETPSNWM